MKWLKGKTAEVYSIPKLYAGTGHNMFSTVINNFRNVYGGLSTKVKTYNTLGQIEP